MSAKPTILVTAAAGKTGSAVALQLLEQGYPVNALVRRQDHRSESLAKAGARVIVGNLIDPNDLRHALQSVQRAYFCAPWTPDQLHGAMNFAVSAADARLEVVGMEGHMMAQLRHYVKEYRRGAFEVGAPNDVVLEVGGSEPENFETITRRYVAANPMARRSVANKLRAFGGFVKILLARTPNIDAYERIQHYPLLRQPKYGLENKQWAIPHSDERAYGTSSAFNQGHLQIQQELGNETGRTSHRQAVA